MTDAQFSAYLLAIDTASKNQSNVIIVYATVIIGIIIGFSMAKGVFDSWSN
jgi:hypothetical protein